MEILLHKNLLEGKKIALGVSGSISIYKSIEIIRLLQKCGATVKVVMSDKALEFISALTFEAISKHKVLTSSSQNWHSSHNHIDFCKSCDLFLLAPATANTINKIASGVADNILLEVILARKSKLIIAPAANTNMLENRITKDNISKLKESGTIFVDTIKKELACGEVGNGALEEPLEIFYRVARELLSKSVSKKVLISGGGSSEKIDDVRSVTNSSSGKMANALAIASYLRGEHVLLISSSFASNLPKGIEKIKYTTSSELKEHIDREVENYEILFMAAAVSDFVPQKYEGKIKKEEIKGFELRMERNIDILKSIKSTKIKKIGFKAESDEVNAFQSAKKMLEEKSLDAVCLNIVGRDIGFGSDENKIDFITNEKTVKLSQKSKLEISFDILRLTQDI